VGPRTKLIFESCCKKGDVDIDRLQSCPSYLQLLFTDQDARSRAFRSHIREYNAALAFTSLKYNQDERVDAYRGVQSFRIHSKLYYLQGPLVLGS
jgi:hypothetical protein